MRILATVAFAVVVAGCTAHNPNYAGGGGSGGGGGGATGGDLGGTGTPDLARPVYDLAGPLGACTLGDRSCSGIVASDRCEGGMFVVDRVCPSGSDCSGGYCAAPTAMPGTQVGARCDQMGGAQQIQCIAKAGLSCQPFVDPTQKTLRWFCDANVGSGTGATHCTKGSDCRSGVCTLQGVCMDTCQQTTDCIQAGTPNLTCVALTIVVEGVTVSQKGCR